ncbi:ShlB/FhaC/HecB family hemolysin secretion/activation protein [Novosphingobium sp.]|uniref:ShlB/FhaC/HecB family hemolysin secretion/activation protein n=1 Tax=Novosphingobium sp. TaxID=1874826 RepID=UPI003D13FD0D
MTPPTLRPADTGGHMQVEIPEAGALTPPAGAETLSVTLSGATIEGGFAEVVPQTEAVLAGLRGRRVTLAQIYAAASEIEAIHARAGYVLARVAVPAQDLHDGGDLRIVVIDGFIEDIDVSGVSPRVRKVVLARTAFLKGRRHLKLGQIEQPLLIAADVPGLSLKSTLVRGGQAGATRIVLEGTSQLVSGSVGGDNQLHPSLGTYSVNAQLSLNSLLGLGEQIYGFVSSGYQIDRIFASDVRERVLGGGAVFGIGDGRLTINPEATFSRTRPAPDVSAPLTTGDLRRLSLRLGYTLVRTRQETFGLTASVEQIDETNNVPSFDVSISHDRYMAARVGLNYSHTGGPFGSWSAGGTVSQGLGGLGALTLADAARSGTPFSRQGASDGFTKLNVQMSGVMSPVQAIDLRIYAAGQSTFGKAVFRAEQSTLEGATAVSAYVGGMTAVDESVTARAELGGRIALAGGKDPFVLAPYVFAAGGVGAIERPTALEPGTIRAAAFGAGARTSLFRPGLTFAVEYAHGISDFRPIAKADRVNFSTSLRF